ncbi:MAG: 16S rRNA (guanine(966)-N(2))-methyltransferase RsmD [Parachlamydiales bacterium]|nr:16S rRNA (guanine(966)-N(2))-methyltransferase RsmD [Parachlamydiales bacterium]
MKIIAGTFKGRNLKAPKSSTTRPTQGMLREAVFNICQNEIEGARFLDLFAGSGAMGLEALSRGASLAVFVEQNRQAIGIIKENISALQVESMAKVIPTNATRALQILEGQKFDLIYIDPPYDLKVDLTPVAGLLSPHGTVFLEERHEPKHKPTSIAGLEMKEVRRFGSSVLTLFQIRRDQ